jgi:hypothetical protein
MRFEVLKRDHEINILNKNLSLEKDQGSSLDNPKQDPFFKTLAEDFDFLVKINMGSEYLANDKIVRLRSIAVRKWLMDGEWQPLLNEEELKNLSIRQGTLTDEERNIINNHATVTHKMLSQLPFPRKMRHVADYAADHHEKIDGTGYPRGRKGDQLSLQSRILAMADIFEALTAKDRPYKKGKKLSEVMKIMGFMVKDRHIEADLFDLFIKERIYLDYAKNELAPHQVDRLDF